MSPYYSPVSHFSCGCFTVKWRRQKKNLYCNDISHFLFVTHSVFRKIICTKFPLVSGSDGFFSHQFCIRCKCIVCVCYITILFYIYRFWTWHNKIIMYPWLGIKGHNITFFCALSCSMVERMGQEKKIKIFWAHITSTKKKGHRFYSFSWFCRI